MEDVGVRVVPSDFRRRVAIVGAGYAGMACAVTLAHRGVPVTVYESGPVPGGDRKSVVWERV